MRYIFPPTKFVKENTVEQQLEHVLSEALELKKECFVTAYDNIRNYTPQMLGEAIDLYHSLETLFRIWEREGVDMEAVMQKVLDKNRAREYYKEGK